MPDHPSSAELSDFVLGKLPPEAGEVVAEHVADCPPCQDTVRNLDAHSDTLLSSLKHRPAAPPPVESECRRAIDKAATYVSAVEPAAAADAKSLSLGPAKEKTFGDYVVLSRIGAGGMGQVFKARHRRMDRIVALKILAKSAMNSPDAVRRFEREARAAARLIHPNIVTAFDAGESQGVHFLVMEFVDGGDLAGLVKSQGPLPVDKAVDYVLQAARGLEYAHGEGVVHRDIKPANLLLDKKGVVKILDMGLARLEGLGADAAAQDGLTQSGQVMGTVDYMAPEQAVDTRTADAKADVYALGCTLHRLLVGENVYGGETLVQKLLAHRENPIPSIAAKRNDVPPAVDAVFRKMVAKRPEERYQTMREVIEALETAKNAPAAPSIQINVAAASRTAVSREAKPSAPAAEPRRAKPQAKGAGRKPPTKWIAAGVGGFALLVLGVILIVRNSKNEEVARIDAVEGTKVTVPAGGSVQVGSLTSTSVATAPVVPVMPVAGAEVDLFAHIDPTKGSMSEGAPVWVWEEQNGKSLYAKTKNVTVSIPIDFQPPAAYRLRAELAPTQPDDPPLGLLFGLRNDSRYFAVMLDAYAGGPQLERFSGITRIAGKSPRDNPTSVPGRLLKRIGPEPRIIDFVVQPDQIRVSVDRKEAFSYAGPMEALSYSNVASSMGGVDVDCFPLWISTREGVRFTSLTLTPLSAEGAAAPPPFLSAITSTTAPAGKGRPNSVVGRFGTGPSPFDALRRENIPPAALAIAGEGDPAKAPVELVAILGVSGTSNLGADPVDIALSDDGRTLVTSSYYDRLDPPSPPQLWDPATGTSRVTLTGVRGSTAVRTMSLTADGRLLATSGQDEVVRLFDATTGAELGQLPEGADVTSLEFNPAGTQLVGGTSDGRVRMWDVASRTRMFEIDANDVSSLGIANAKPSAQKKIPLTFHPDGKSLVVAALCTTGEKKSKQSALVFYDAATGKRLSSLRSVTQAIGRLKFGPDGQTLYFEGGSNLYSLDLRRPPAPDRDEFDARTPGFYNFAVSPGGRLIAGFGAKKQDVLTLYDAATMQELKSWPIPVYGRILFDPTERYLLVGLGDGTAYVLRLVDPPVALLPSGEGGRRPDESNVAAGSLDIPHPGPLPAGEGGLSSPLDTLKRENIPADELKAAGFGDPAKAPAELVAVVGDSRWKTWGNITSMVLSPDGSMVATGGSDAAVVLWDAATGQPRHWLAGHEGGTDGIAFSPDGKRLATVGRDQVLRMWDTTTGAAGKTLTSYERAVAFSPDGRLIAAQGPDDAIALWDFDAGRVVQRLPTVVAIIDVRFSPDGKSLAALVNDKTIRVWELATGKETVKIAETQQPRCLMFSPDSQSLAYGRGGTSGGQGVTFYDLAAKRETASWQGHAYSVVALAYSPDGKTFASGGADGLIILWDAVTGAKKAHLRRHSTTLGTYTVSDVAFSPDGQTLFASYQDHAILQWDVAAATERPRPSGHAAKATSAVVTADGRTVATASSDMSVRLWDVPTMRERAPLEGHGWPVNRLAFSPDGRTLASASMGAERGGTGHSTLLWDVAAGVQKTWGGTRVGEAIDVAFASDGKWFATGHRNGSVRLWDSNDGADQASFDTGSTVMSLAVSPDRLTVASGGVSVSNRPPVLQLWDVAARQLRTTLQTSSPSAGFAAIAYSSDGTLLAAASGEFGSSTKYHIHVWDTATGQIRGTSAILARRFNSVMFAPDGRTIVTAGDDGAVRFWDAATLEPTRTIQLGPSGGSVNQATFDATGRYVITANGNGTAYVLRLSDPPTPKEQP